MNLFAVLQRANDDPISERLRRQLLGASCCKDHQQLRWLDVGRTTVLLGIDPCVGLRPTMAHHGRYFGVGVMRLDHPEEIATLAGVSAQQRLLLSDMELALRALERLGERFVDRLIGDFAFVAIDSLTHDVLAARDAFGVKTLYYADGAEMLAFASRAELLAKPEQYDIQYIAEFLSGARPGRASTIYEGVRPVAPGSTLSVRAHTRSERKFWTPATFAMRQNEPATSTSAGKIAEFRELFARAVSLRMTGEPNTWSELSGGLDSSSVVSMAQTLARSGKVASGLGGTVTVVDTAGTGGDEREYSDAVVQMHGVRNDLMSDFWMLQDDGEPAPCTDQPACRLLFYARDRAIYEHVRRAGGSVLLGGQASDQYLTGYIFFVADWLARGQAGRVIREMTRWSVLGEVSFWELAFKNVVMPFLPPWLNARVSRNAALPPWIRRSIARQFDLGRQQIVVRAYSGPIGQKYSSAIVRSVGDIPYGLDRGIVNDHLEFRYPFLYRPLVELALALPSEFCAVPTKPKWILRQAMAGILPEVVRQRRGKGAIDARLAWSLAHERGRVERLLRSPILAELGCIDAPELRTAVDAAIHGNAILRGGVVDALALELWLATQSGRQTVAVPALHDRGTTAVAIHAS